MNSPGVTPQRCGLCEAGFHPIDGCYLICPRCEGNAGVYYAGRVARQTEHLITDMDMRLVGDVYQVLGDESCQREQ